MADVSISRHGSSVLLIWRIEDEAARLASLLQHAQRLGRIGGFEENLLTGEITWNGAAVRPVRPAACRSPRSGWTDLAAHAHPDDAVAIGRFLRTLLHHRRPASAAFRLQRPDGVTRHIRIVAEPVLDTDGAAGRRTRGLSGHLLPALDGGRAGRHPRPARPHRAARPPNATGWPCSCSTRSCRPRRRRWRPPACSVAVRYRPAETEHLVGGDWYDAVVLPSGLVLLCVGDVAGHGIEAATSMVVLRNALRGLAVTGAGPAQLLSWLNMVAHHLTGLVTATAVCGLYDPSRHTLRWARAGHLPPRAGARRRGRRRCPCSRDCCSAPCRRRTYEEARGPARRRTTRC